MSARFRTIWLSDTHLGTRDCRALGLLEFLDEHECDFLYLVGDIVDFWSLARAPYWAHAHSDVLRRVLARAGAGTLVTFVPGNHDEYARRFCDVQLGNVMIVREAVHRTADGRPLLVLHGDEFDAVTRWNRWVAWLGGRGYDLLMWLNRRHNEIRRRLGLGHWSLAGYVWRARRAIRYIQEFEHAAARAAARRGMAGVVCGHIHRPALRTIGATLYGNAGDWVENCTALVEREDGVLALLSFADARRAELATIRPESSGQCRPWPRSSPSSSSPRRPSR